MQKRRKAYDYFHVECSIFLFYLSDQCLICFALQMKIIWLKKCVTKISDQTQFTCKCLGFILTPQIISWSMYSKKKKTRVE